MKFEHLFAPMQVGKVTYRNRIVSAPMAFGLIVQNPAARDFTYRKLEASAKGGKNVVETAPEELKERYSEIFR